MEVILFLDFHHEGLSIVGLANFHVPLMQFIHSRWEVLDLLRLDQRFAADIFSFYVLLSKRRHGIDLEELSNSDTEHFSIPCMLVGYYQLTGVGTLMCVYNKLGDRLRRLFSQLGEWFSRIFCQLLSSSSSSTPSVVVLDVPS